LDELNPERVKKFLKAIRDFKNTLARAVQFLDEVSIEG
jgi:hypothetical protein